MFKIVAEVSAVQFKKVVETNTNILKSGNTWLNKVLEICLKVIVTVTTTFKSDNDLTLPSLHKMAPMQKTLYQNAA